MKWQFIANVIRGTKALPLSYGIESIDNLPNLPELSAKAIYIALMTPLNGENAGFLRFRRYMQPSENILRDKVDRNYIFAVLKWVRPGTITRLLRHGIERNRAGTTRIPAGDIDFSGPMVELAVRANKIKGKKNNRVGYWMVFFTNVVQS